MSPSRTISHSSKPSLDRKDSVPLAAKASPGFTPRTVAAPPPYTSNASSSSITKKGPPPPPPLKPKPSYNAIKYCTAIFDFEAQVSSARLSALLCADRSRPKGTCLSALAIGSRLLNSRRARMTGGPAGWTGGRASSREHIPRWTRCRTILGRLI